MRESGKEGADSNNKPAAQKQPPWLRVPELSPDGQQAKRMAALPPSHAACELATRNGDAQNKTSSAGTRLPSTASSFVC